MLVSGGESKKEESVDSELACGRVSKFYWLVAIRSRAWGLVSLIVSLIVFFPHMRLCILSSVSRNI